MIPAFDLRGIRKSYGSKLALNGITLKVGSGELIALVGASGCGKTTLLKLLNGLEKPSEGEIRIDGRPQSEYKPIQLRRRMGYVIQDTGLLPHLTVLENIALLGRVEGHKRTRREIRVGELLSIMQLDYETYAHRYPHELSGGQKQRVGVARALYLNPPFLLMDEPFGALDPVTRFAIQRSFLEIKAALQKTIILVTHDVREALALADRVAVMASGRLVQIDKPAKIRQNPVDHRVRDLLETGGLT